MYDEKKRQWIFQDDEEKARACCARAEGTEEAETLWIAADYLLSRARQQERNIDGVFYMQKAAQSGHADAMFAMGQMAEYGWAVGKSRKNALNWYQKAAKAGQREAGQALRRLKRKQRVKAAAFLAVALAATLISLAVFLLMPGGSSDKNREKSEETPTEDTGRGRVVVGEDTQLEETDTLEEFNESVRELADEYDDELVISGERSTNRLILKFEGKELNLSEFLADRVIARENNMVIIQFASEEEAFQCLESLKEMEQISFVEMDEYNISADPAGSRNTREPQESAESREALDLAARQKPQDQDASSGLQYYTWGCEDMGLDQLALYLAGNAPLQSATVAVLDTGVKPVDGISDRVLPGVDVVMGGDGRTDLVGHGTHVSGTILDCTQGLDVNVLPVGIFGENPYTSTMNICMGLEYAIEQSPEVINMSLGGPIQEEDSWQQELIHQAVSEGITVVVSAGNGDESGTPVDTAGYMPAALDECIVVGAVDREHNIAPFSNYGDSVDVCAPGVDITSYSIRPEGLESMDGTSMAAPHISALAVMLSMYVPDAAPGQIEKYIKDYCVWLGDELYYGEGIPQGAFYIEY